MILIRQMDKLECMNKVVIYEKRSGENLSEFMTLRTDTNLSELKS